MGARMRWKKLCSLAMAAALATVGVGFLESAPASAATAGRLVNADPADFTPQIQDGDVKSIVQIGDRIFLGGSFTQVKEVGAGKPVLTRTRVLAFDATTGKIDTSFAPTVDKGEVSVLLPAPDGRSVYAGGNFSNINGQRQFVLTRLDTATGQPITSFKPQLNAKVKDLRLAGGRLIVAGDFTTVGGVARTALAALNPETGARDDFLDANVAGTHNGGVTFVLKIDVTPDGSHLVGVGNFTTVAGQSRPQIFMLDLTGSSAQLANWGTSRYGDLCSSSFNTYMRDVDFSPDGSFFVVTTTGAPRGTNLLCDTQARWENVTNGTGKQPTWVNWTGGDTTYAVEITDHVVYTGGHFRWSNNAYGSDNPGQGAVDRQGIAALDPSNGLPFTWNPGRTRGVGVFDLLVTEQGLWMGSDTDMAGGETHQKIAMFPAAGGTALPRLETAKLPGDVYYGGSTSGFGSNYLRHRSFDGTTAGAQVTDGTAGFDWRTARGAFMLSGKLYHGSSNGNLYARTFDGASLGEPVNMDGGDQLTPMSTWHSQVKNIQGMFYYDGKIYYTRGLSSLNYRYFTPESKVVGAVELTATPNLPGVDWRYVGGMFVAGGKLYYVHTSDGRLRSLDFTAGVPTGSPTVVDSGDWRGRAVFVRADTPNETPTATFTRTCADLKCAFDASASSDPDGTIASYAWDFGDGKTGTGATPEHTYAAAGTYTVKLTVTDHRGGTDVSEQTVKVAENRAGIAYRGTDGFNANSKAPAVTVPSGVEAGDGMLLFLTLNSTAVTVTPPAGWTQVGTQSNTGSVSTVWRRVAEAGDAGKTVTVDLSDYAKADLRLAAYAHTGATPVAEVAKASDAVQNAHQAPNAPVAEPGSWVVTYWSEKSSATTAWTAPETAEKRAVSIGTGGGRITSLLVDSGGAVPTGTYAGLTATADSASRALMWTIVLRPTS